MTPSLQFLIHDTDTFCPTQAADPWLFASVRIRDPRTGHDLTLCFGEASTAARLADALARLAVEWLAQSAPVDPDWKSHDENGLKPPGPSLEPWPCAAGDHGDCVGQAELHKGEWNRCPCDCHKTEGESTPSAAPGSDVAEEWKMAGPLTAEY